MNRFLLAAVLTVSGIGVGIGSVPLIGAINSALNAPAAPISDGAQALVESLESGKGWRLLKHGNGVLNQSANVMVDIRNRSIKRADEQDMVIDWYKWRDYQPIMEAAKKLKEKLLLSHFKNVEPGPNMGKSE